MQKNGIMMDTLRASDLLWYTLELNPFPEDSSQTAPRTLKDFCSEKLVSDVCLLRGVVLNLPKKIFSILFFKAIDENRILSAIELIKNSPLEEIQLLPPNALRNLSEMKAKNSVKNDELKKFCGVALSILSAFLEITSKKESFSKLKTLDLASVPMDRRMLKVLGDFIERSHEKTKKVSRNTAKKLKYNPNDIFEPSGSDLESCVKQLDFQGQYTLKCALVVESGGEMMAILRCYMSTKNISFQLIISGILFYNFSPFIICPVSKIFKILSTHDFQLIAFMFSEFSLKCVFSELEKFKNLKYLNLSHLSDIVREEYSLKEFSASLSVLTNLKRLVLRGFKFTDCLKDLFCEFCKRKQDVTDCCLTHCGSLEYLDISGCYLVHDDIGFLKELAASSSLKYLDISDNFLETESTLQTLLSLSSSLLVLKMKNCFADAAVEYNSETFPLRAFTQIRYLNIKGMKITDTSKQMLRSELENMTFECIKTDAEAPYDVLSYEQFTMLHS